MCGYTRIKARARHTYLVYWQGKDRTGFAAYDGNTNIEWAAAPGPAEMSKLNASLLEYAKSQNSTVTRVVIKHMCRLGA